MTIAAYSTTKKNYTQWAPFFLRLVIGFGFIVHGWAKLSNGPAGFEKLLTQLNIPFPYLSAWITSLIELLGGFALILGFFVSLTTVPLIIIMLVTMFTAQFDFGTVP
ncbi:DoxX family protein [Pedobacter ginsengisoli]|uniref:DoxX family protein n=1 Tax=Pedobacter ginsengisoli TaxID=363852 RepID=UPI001C12A637|nr:DoxX family protein [Pedobacter ginsengisoli]